MQGEIEMKTSKQSKTPIWRKSMLKKLGLSDIKEQLWEISDNGDAYGYDSGDESGYYAEYKDQFDELSAQAGMMLEALDSMENEWYVDEYDAEEQWNDITVGMLGELYTVLGYDGEELDYYNILSHEEDMAQEETIKRLSRLTKPELIKRMQYCLKMIVLFYDLKAAHDCLTSIVETLDEKGAILERKNDEIDRIYEDITGKDSDNFDTIVASLPQRMWVE
jgi:hypothetical protein